MDLLEAIVLGLIQGLTEFLPVSSSGHLELGKYLFGINPGANFYFSIAVHGATVLSTLVVFRKEIAQLASGFLRFEFNEETAYILKLFISMIPVGFVGIFLKDEVEGLYNGNMLVIGSMLLFTALLLTIGHFARPKQRNLGFFNAFIIGIVQAIAVIPGISRSGTTISTGLIIGNRKNEIARFSFLMVLVPVLGANFLEIISDERIIGETSPVIIIIGSVTAFISGYFACKWMINLVRRSKMIWFALYCAVIGILTILFL